MALRYLKQLPALVPELFPQKPRGIKLEVKHFFSGAALYVDGKIFITLTPKGLAMKVPEDIRKELLEKKKAKPLRYFRGAPIKKRYVLLPKKSAKDLRFVKKLARLSMKYVIHLE